MHLYIVRHGQTEANLKNLCNGRNSGDLTPYGAEQARALVPQMEKAGVELIFSSPLVRAVHTARILNVGGLEIVTDERINERDVGRYTLQPVELLEADKRFDPDFFDPDVEPYEDIKARVGSFLEELRAKYPDKRILIVSHGDTIVAMQELLGHGGDPYPQTCTLLEYEV